MTDNFNKKIEYGAKELGLELSDGQKEKMFRYYELLTEKNKVMNLTAVTDENEVIDKHFIDSLSIIKYVGSDFKGKILDVGTGAGFPGAVLAIALPDCHITMLDAINKKLKFIQESCEAIGIDNATVIHGRAEDLAHNPEYRERFDVVTARAVANLSTLCEYCIPFTSVNGKFISYKSAAMEDELFGAEKAIKTLKCEVSSVERFMLPGTDIERSLIVFVKKAPAPQAYPRKAGLPSKEPL